MGGEKLVCGFCGSLIEGHAYVHKGTKYCCEGCFLKEKEFRAKEAELDNAYLAMSEALVKALDIRERETGLHSKRVACHTLTLARHFTGDQEKLRQVYWGALLHDIGKIGVSDAVLLKEGPLTDDEWREMKEHPVKGSDILSAAPFMSEAAEIVLCHEERYDGGGYPRGLAGEDIHWGARVFSVIDALDAITSDRPYRKGGSFDEAKEEIIRCAGVQFDPDSVEIFLSEEKTLREMVSMKCGGASHAPGGGRVK